MKYTIISGGGQKITREAPAIIVAARNEYNEITVFLDRITGNKAKKETDGIVKRSHGVKVVLYSYKRIDGFTRRRTIY